MSDRLKVLSRQDLSQELEIAEDAAIVARPVSTRDDLFIALKLVHDCYVRREYMHPREAGIRICPHYAVPGARTWMLEVADQPVATVSMFPDTPLGLPADAPYGRSLRGLRQRGQRLAEIGMLADRRTSLSRSMPGVMRLMPLILQAARDAEIDHLIITCHPRHEKFYRKLLGFEHLEGPRAHPSVLDAPSVLDGLDLTKADLSQVRHTRLREMFAELQPPANPGPPYEMTDDDAAWFYIHQSDTYYRLPNAWRKLIRRCHPKLDPADERKKSRAKGDS
jgi:hypothetical protein